MSRQVKRIDRTKSLLLVHRSSTAKSISGWSANKDARGIKKSMFKNRTGVTWWSYENVGETKPSPYPERGGS